MVIISSLEFVKYNLIDFNDEEEKGLKRTSGLY